MKAHLSYYASLLLTERSVSRLSARELMGTQNIVTYPRNKAAQNTIYLLSSLRVVFQEIVMKLWLGSANWWTIKIIILVKSWYAAFDRIRSRRKNEISLIELREEPNLSLQIADYLSRYLGECGHPVHSLHTHSVEETRSPRGITV